MKQILLTLILISVISSCGTKGKNLEKDKNYLVLAEKLIEINDLT